MTQKPIETQPANVDYEFSQIPKLVVISCGNVALRPRESPYQGQKFADWPNSTLHSHAINPGDPIPSCAAEVYEAILKGHRT